MHEYMKNKIIYKQYIGGLVQERRNSIANALKLRLSCVNPSMYFIQIDFSALKLCLEVWESPSCIYHNGVLLHVWDVQNLSKH